MTSDLRGRVIGNYRLEEKLGQGGMGVVWRARDVDLERDVAIKMMVPRDDAAGDEAAARFLVEAKAAARVSSRHVAQVMQLGKTDSGEVYIVMELLQGTSLKRLLQWEGKLEPARAVRIARQIAKGMQAAHALGIVHRDLKPANVMLVSADGDDEVVKVLDFGVAKLTKDGNQGLTQNGALVGTLAYMAPEQINAEPVDARADIYALGVILYRLLSGVQLFESDSLTEQVRLQTTVKPIPLIERAPNIPAALDAVVLRCLEKKREDRWPSMAELDLALARALEETSVTGTALQELLAGDTADAVFDRAEPTLVTAALEATAPAGAPAPAAAALGEATLTGEEPRPRPAYLVPAVAAAVVVVVVAVVIIVLKSVAASGGEAEAEKPPHEPSPVADSAVVDGKPVDAAPPDPAAEAKPADADAEAKPVDDGAAKPVTVVKTLPGTAVERPKAHPKAKLVDKKPTFVRVHTKDGG